jgi:hypothetical protein
MWEKYSRIDSPPGYGRGPLRSQRCPELVITARRPVMVGHLIVEVAACGGVERDDLYQTPRKVRRPTTPGLPVYADDRKLVQSHTGFLPV